MSVPSGVVLESNDVLRFSVRSVAGVAVSAGSAFVSGVRLVDGEPVRLAVGLARTLTATWALERVGTLQVPFDMVMTSIAGVYFQGTPEGLLHWFGVEAFKSGDTNNAYWSFGAFRGTDFSWFWEPGALAVSPLYSPETPGKLFTFQGTVVNGAGGAGTQSLTITPPAGGRFYVLWADVLNGDTDGRVIAMTVTDGTNELLIAPGASTAGGQRAQFPPLPTALGNNNQIDSGGRYGPFAGGDELIFSVIAVALSQDSAYAVRLEVWGAAPALTLAGASTPTLTTNTSRFEAG